MNAGGRLSSWLQLNKLFLRQFLENDLVSPDADRAQLLAIVGAGVVSLTLFVSMFLSAAYAMTVLTPGEAAVRTLNDKFFYSALAMLITALVAAAQWDALVVDHRDAAILDPLPVRPAIVRWAKLSAVAMLGAGAALAVNVFPTLVFPWMLSFSLRQMAAADVFRLMAIHAMVTVTAAVFGYLAVMAMRESVSALLGPKLFTRISPSLQALTIVVLGSLLLLLPPASTRVASIGFSGWPSQLPPMAFVGLYEVASNAFLVDLPRRRVPARMAARDRSNTAVYERLRPRFRLLARRVEVLLGTVAGLLVAATVVNGLRAPVSGALLTARGRRRSRLAEAAAHALLVRHPAARAGFHFALATLFRSKTHRLTLACAAAVGLSMALVVLSRIDLQSGRLSPGLLSIQPLLYGSLLVAFRHLIRVPAELRANWAVQLAWRGHPLAFTRGVRRAAIVALALPAIVAVVPVVAIVSGGAVAVGHALLGIAGAAIFVEGLMLGYQKAPFACSYVPGNGKGFVPIFALGFLLGASLFARLELAVIEGSNASTALIVLGVVFVALRIASARQRDLVIDFDEGPEVMNQLGLHT
jgi:hypothetical protein